ncbi:MAG: hypothetical protein JSW40_03545 [Candidatus Omnitrophota bacterium]|nr:MAG: hypothetical protein JSW40_03545 [Candidatus Omnitrophota bacterium]
MKKKSLANAVISGAIASGLLFLIVSGCTSNISEPQQLSKPMLPHSMEGYEIYSWQERGEWYFSLLSGANRSKVYEEVTSPDVAISGIVSLKEELVRLPKNELIVWATYGIIGLQLPPTEVIRDIQIYCGELGLTLVTPLSIEEQDNVPVPH